MSAWAYSCEDQTTNLDKDVQSFLQDQELLAAELLIELSTWKYEGSDTMIDFIDTLKSVWTNHCKYIQK